MAKEESSLERNSEYFLSVMKRSVLCVCVIEGERGNIESKGKEARVKEKVSRSRNFF